MNIRKWSALALIALAAACQDAVVSPVQQDDGLTEAASTTAELGVDARALAADHANADGSLNSSSAMDSDLRASGFDFAAPGEGDLVTAQSHLPGPHLHVTPGISAQQMAQLLSGPGVTISNVSFAGAGNAKGAFSGGTGIIGIEEGVMLSSGNVSTAVGPNNSDGATTAWYTAGDASLNALIPQNTYDAAVLEFDFQADADQVAFEYVFTSEEYNEYTYSSYNDVFAFFVNGFDQAHNCAKLPDGRPVSINNVNGGKPYGYNPSYPGLFRNNDLQDGGGSINTQMDGLTVVLVCTAQVDPHGVNHMKLAIADAGDRVLDSNVFLKGGSLSTTLPGQISLSPNAADVDLPGDHDVTVTVRKSDNTPVAGADVDFDVISGPHAGLHVDAVTNQSGQVVIHLDGAGPGTDAFKACFYDDQAQQDKCADGTVTWISLNSPPTAFIEDDISTSHGQVIETEVFFQDPDVGDSWTSTIDWGDGSALVGGPITPDTKLDLTHQFPDMVGSWTITFKVTDSHGEVSTATQTVTYTNAPPKPVIDLGQGNFCYYLEAEQSCVNGGPTEDPDDDVSTLHFFFDYGDGTSYDQVGVTGQPPHYYVDNGTYTVTLTVVDPLGASAQVTKDVVVGNQVPTVNAGADATVDFAEAFNLTATFSDPGIVDNPWNWSVDWGNGDGVSGSTDDQSTAFGGSVTYYSAGDFYVNACVEDKDGGIGCATVTVTVTATFDGLCALVETYVSHHGVANSLCVKLAAAERADNRGNLKARDGSLNAFINEVEAQTGKKVPADKAWILIAYAEALMS